MFDFAEFYQNGGVFMHAISLTTALAALALALDARARKLGDAEPERLRLADRLLLLGVGFGLLGTAMGMTDLFVALGMVLTGPSPEQAMLAFARGGAIVPAPLIWSLLTALPLWIVGTLLRHRAPRRRSA